MARIKEGHPRRTEGGSEWRARLLGPTAGNPFYRIQYKDPEMRLVTALLNTSLHLERIGDTAVNVATIADLIEGLPGDPEVLGLLGSMVDQAAVMVETAMAALAARDAEQAQSLVRLDDQLDGLDRELFTRSLELDDSAEQREWAFRMHETLPPAGTGRRPRRRHR